MTRKAKRLARTTVILMIATGWGTFEIGWGGAREGVLVLVGGLFAIAAGVNVDDAIREKRRDRSG